MMAIAMTATCTPSSAPFLLPCGLVLLAVVAGGAASGWRTPGRLTLESIAGTDWVLRTWTLNDAAPATPEVTLALKDGKFVGTAGCNRYFAGVKAGDMPGDVTLGLVGATRMMCPPEQMAVENRFLKQLAGVKKFGFMAGQLALSYDTEGVRGVMLFDPRGTQPAPTPR